MKTQQSDQENVHDTARNSDNERALAALKRAAKVAHRRAAQNGAPVSIYKDGKVIQVDAWELLKSESP